MFFLVPPNFIDPTDPTVVSRFHDPATGLPVRIGSTASGVFEDLGLVPQIWLSGPASMFADNLAAGTWTGLASVYNDTTPSSSFTAGAGRLVTAATDPWSGAMAAAAPIGPGG